MNLIVSADNNWGIGCNNDLLYKIPADMVFFKNMTINKVVVMGRNTLSSLPNSKPLKNRTNIVVTSQKDLKADGCVVLNSVEDVLKYIKKFKEDEVFIIGGECVFKEFLPYCKYAYITRIDSEKKADKFFPNLDKLKNWKMVEKSEPQNFEGLEYSYCKYENVGVK